MPRKDRTSKAKKPAEQERGEPGEEDPGSHTFDKEVHPADESARRAGSGGKAKKKSG